MAFRCYVGPSSSSYLHVAVGYIDHSLRLILKENSTFTRYRTAHSLHIESWHRCVHLVATLLLIYIFSSDVRFMTLDALPYIFMARGATSLEITAVVCLCFRILKQRSIF